MLARPRPSISLSFFREYICFRDTFKNKPNKQETRSGLFAMPPRLFPAVRPSLQKDREGLFLSQHATDSCLNFAVRAENRSNILYNPEAECAALMPFVKIPFCT